MYLFGFHILDVIVIAGYLALITYIGKRTSAKIKTQEDFFLAGRTVGKLLQYFFNMSTIVDANSAVRTASFSFHKGLGGVWLMLNGIFTGPYYWFMAGWFRRVRLITMAELFEERFKSKSLASIYAFVGIWLSIIILGVGYKTSLRTFEAMTIKPIERCTAEEKQNIAMYQEYRSLDKLYKENKLASDQRTRYQALDSMQKKDQIYAYTSYTNTVVFYIVYTLFVALYTIMGGLEAAIWADLIQGVLIFIFSIILIPLSLIKLGGWSEFTARVPDNMLYVFGSGLDEFSAASIAALVLVSIIGITGHQGNMSNNGSAKDELTARIGNIGGAYTKRILTIMWAFCGLLAFALYRDSISDPDAAWGVMSNDLLGIGLRGFMIAGILAANMSTLSGVCVYLSALFVRHLYKPFFNNKDEKHYITVSRFSIAGILLLGIYISVSTGSVINVIMMLPSLMTIFGAPVLLLLFWKRLTLAAVYAQVILCTIILACLPQILPQFEMFEQSKFLTQQTFERTDEKKKVIIQPSAIYYDSVARKNPDDPNSPMVGIGGRLHTELIIARMLGLNLQKMKPSTLLTVRYLVASFLPFAILIPVSLFTKNKGLEENIARFYVKMKTRVLADRAMDNAELEKSYAAPARFDHTKLFPNSNWEFCKWTKEDFWGFLASSALTVVILLLFWGLIKWIAM